MENLRLRRTKQHYDIVEFMGGKRVIKSSVS